MKTYNTVNEYLKECKPNDRILLGGNGIMCGINSAQIKQDTYKVHKNTNKDKLVVRHYKGRTNYVLGANGYDQKVAVLTDQEFKQLE